MSGPRIRKAQRGLRNVFCLLLFLMGAAGLLRGQEEDLPRRGVLLFLDGAVTPASADYITRGIRAAAEEDAHVVVLRIDTPGGLDASMRAIIREILAAPVPVISWVGPAGARAASAGTYILYASHVAAMAPGTNLGAATPVQLGGGLPFGGADDSAEEGGAGPAEEPPGEEAGRQPADVESDAGGSPAFAPQTAGEAKAVNDAVAYIRGLAELRGRNADWAERAVREAASLEAPAAAAENVVDVVAPSLDVLLAELDGRVVSLGDREVTLHTANLVLDAREPGLRTRILSVITDPNVALLLMVFGFYGIVFELISPGALVPGTIGAICLLLGFYALSVLPLTLAGVALLLLGAALVVAEAFAPSFGVLGIGGAVALTLGATLLVDTDVPGLGVSWAVVAAIGVASLLFAVLVAWLARRAFREKVHSGREELVGAEATVLDWSAGRGGVHVHGERWQARGPATLASGDLARVRAVDGLTLDVEWAGAARREAPLERDARSQD